MTERAGPERPPAGLPGALFHRWTWRMAWRDSRSQRGKLAVFASAIVAGIASLVAIHSLRASLEDGIEGQARALLGSDMQVSSRQPVPEESAAALTEGATRVSRETAFSSMLYFPKADAARLVQVRALDGDYPFYGSVITVPADAWEKHRSGSGVLVEAALLDQFQAQPGDVVKLGDAEFRIEGVVTRPAPPTSRFSGFAPEVYIRRSSLDATGLTGTASLQAHLLHIEFPPGVSASARKREMREQFPDESWRIETPEDRKENISDALDGFQRFLGIIAMASLVLGAIGVACAIHAHVSRRIPSVAVLRCLGASGGTAFAVYAVQAAGLGAAGALLGTAAGLVLHQSVLHWFGASLPIAIDTSPPWAAIGVAAGSGLAVCCGFAMVPLLKVLRVSPGATLRDSPAFEGGSRGRSWWVWIVPAATILLPALLTDPDTGRALGLIGGLAAAFLILLGVARGLMFLSRRLAGRRWPYVIRQGLNNLHRPHNQTLLFLLSLGLATFLVVTILLARRLLDERLSLTRHAESPNLYLIDVQADQVDGVKRLVEEQDLPVLEAAPMVVMRIGSVKGEPVRGLARERRVPRWVARREFRSTWRAELNSTETVVAGEWFPGPAEPGRPVPLSLEEKLAGDLGVTVGDEITLDVQGVEMPAVVTSLRRVDWSRFNLNFFMVFPPGVLENAPGFHVVTTRIPGGRSSGEVQRALATQFPNVSVIDLKQILDTVRSILEKIGLVVAVLAAFTVLAALPVLAGTLLHGRETRFRESVLLRTLGASARQVRLIFVVEYAALGLLSAVAGTVLAVAANAGLALRVFRADPWPDGWLLAGAVAVSTAVAVGGGLLLSRGVSRHPPLEILRNA